MRADRSGCGFALVAFQFGNLSDAEAGLSRIQERIRATDYVGELARDEIGVVLWNTNQAGADIFLNQLAIEAAIEGTARIRVSVYPDFSTDESSHDIDQPASVENGPIDSKSSGEPVPVPADDRSESWKSAEDQPAFSRVAQRESISAFLSQPLPAWKRAIDILGAGVGIIVLSPLFLLVAIVIKLDSRGSILFRQQRRGLANRAFSMYKFRTMVEGAEHQRGELEAVSEQDGPAFKLRNDPRITRIGRYLRLSCIDELPQLFNVLRGEMTIVGPRPLPLVESDQCSAWQSRRLDATPGLTCIWQVHGKSKVSFEDWMRMDIRYIGSRNFLLDCKLIVQTALAVVLHRASH